MSATLSPSCEQLYGVARVCEVWEIPRSTLYAWRTKGQGPKALRLGRHLRYRMKDVETWLQSREL